MRGGVCDFKSYVARNIEKKPARLVEAGVLVRVHVQRTVRVHTCTCGCATHCTCTCALAYLPGGCGARRPAYTRTQANDVKKS